MRRGVSCWVSVSGGDRLVLGDGGGSGWQFMLNRECLPVQSVIEREFDCS